MLDLGSLVFGDTDSVHISLLDELSRCRNKYHVTVPFEEELRPEEGKDVRPNRDRDSTEFLRGPLDRTFSQDFRFFYSSQSNFIVGS